eukprot:scaffold21329_cov139-Skeletonema_marinoi.AAC.2
MVIVKAERSMPEYCNKVRSGTKRTGHEGTATALASILPPSHSLLTLIDRHHVDQSIDVWFSLVVCDHN